MSPSPLVPEIEALLLCSNLGNPWFEEDVLIWHGDDPEHRRKRPGEHSGLPARELGDCFNPPLP